MATVGRAGTGKQNVWLSPECGVGAATHELGHTLGLFHTQTRWDRGTWIVYHEANVQADHHSEYELKPDALAIGPYDYGSIMSYGPYTFNNEHGSTMDAPLPLGQREGPSRGDVAAVEWLHNGCADTQTRIQCASSYGAWAYAVRPGMRFEVPPAPCTAHTPYASPLLPIDRTGSDLPPAPAQPATTGRAWALLSRAPDAAGSY